MRPTRCFSAVAAALSMILSTSGAEAEKHIQGVGSLKCENYLAAQEEGRWGRYDFQAWAEGYVSAKYEHPHPFFGPAMTFEPAIEAICKKYPGMVFWKAVEALQEDWMSSKKQSIVEDP